MKLSDNTISVLKNFSTLGKSMLLKPGKKQAVIEKNGSIYAEAILDEEFPTEFGIYDIGSFINNFSLSKESNVNFKENVAVIGDDNFNINFRAASTKIINLPPDNIRDQLKIDEPVAKFLLNSDSLQKAIKVSSMNALPDIAVERKNNVLYLRAFDEHDDSTSEGWIKLGDSAGDDFKSVFMTEFFNKLIVQDYDVTVGHNFSQFDNKNNTMTYLITRKMEQQ